MPQVIATVQRNCVDPTTRCPRRFSGRHAPEKITGTPLRTSYILAYELETIYHLYLRTPLGMRSIKPLRHMLRLGVKLAHSLFTAQEVC